MSFDLEKLQAVADLGEVIRLQNEALERLQAFRKARPYMVMPNLMKVVEENLKENLQVLYKEFNNLHKPAEQQTRYICSECKMAFVVKLPGGICDECRARLATKPRNYVLPPITEDEELEQPNEPVTLAEARIIEQAEEEQAEEVAEDVENATTGDKEPVDVEEVVATETEKAKSAEAQADTEGLSDEFQKFMAMAGTPPTGSPTIEPAAANDFENTDAESPASDAVESSTADSGTVSSNDTEEKNK